nr:NADH dehydrogenase subunit 6 [Folsomia candida]
MKTIILASITVSSMFYLSSHPVIMMILIISQTMILCLTAWVNMKISWFSYILFLIFLGGLMVLFIYITSLASNELMTIKMINSPKIFSVMVLVTTLIFVNVETQSAKDTGASFFLLKTFNFMYSSNNCALLATAMIYLLLTLIIVVKISNKFEAPLKNMIFN